MDQASRSLVSARVEPAYSSALEPRREAPPPLLALDTPDLARIVEFCCGGQRTDLTLMFADLVIDGRGDSAGKNPEAHAAQRSRLCAEFVRLVRGSVERDGTGCLVAQLGNSALAVFMEAGAAVECAQEIQRGIARENEGRPLNEQLSVKIGLAAGSSGDSSTPDGSMIHRMAYDAGLIADAAPPGQILLNAAVYERARGVVYAGNTLGARPHLPRMLPARALSAPDGLWQVAPEHRGRLLVAGARTAASSRDAGRRILATLSRAFRSTSSLAAGSRRIATSPLLLVLIGAVALLGWAATSPKLRDGALSLATYARAVTLPGSNLPPKRGRTLAPASRGPIGLNMRGKDLRSRDFSGARLARADLRDANLIWADFRGADLSSASLVHASLFRTDLQGADLRGADLRLVRNILFADLRYARYDRRTRWPRGFSPRAHGARPVPRLSSRRTHRPG